MKRLAFTYMLLLALLAITLLAYRYPLTPFQTPIALGIAAFKMILVAWVFMQLRSGSGIERVIASAGLLWIVFFYLISALDLFFRPNMPGSNWR